MTHFEPEGEPEDTADLRNAAVKALQSAVRQHDPHEFDRLTRHALGLLQRARVIGHGLACRDRRDAGCAGRKRDGENRGYWRTKQVEGQIHRHALSAIFVEGTLSMSKTLLISTDLVGLAVTGFLQGAVAAHSRSLSHL